MLDFCRISLWWPLSVSIWEMPHSRKGEWPYWRFNIISCGSNVKCHGDPSDCNKFLNTIVKILYQMLDFVRFIYGGRYLCWSGKRQIQGKVNDPIGISIYISCGFNVACHGHPSYSIIFIPSIITLLLTFLFYFFLCILCCVLVLLQKRSLSSAVGSEHQHC